MAKENLYFVWTTFQRRALAFEDEFNCRIVNLPTDSGSKIGKVAKYLQRAWEMVGAIVSQKPNQVWLQLPPNFLVPILLVARLFTRQEFSLIADCHNAALRRPWISLPLSIWSLNRCDLVIVHNSDVLAQALQLGIRKDRLFVLEDAPAYLGGREYREANKSNFVLVPCSFRDDEPISELLAAAKECGSVEFILTGPIARASAKGYLERAGPNVNFAGFVSTEDFDELVWGASAILGLTTVDGIQLSVAGEAVGAGKALILSDTDTLRRLFGDTAVFCSNTACSIALAVADALENRRSLEELSRSCRRHRVAVWSRQADRVHGKLRV